jgi:SpoVK/Ycf46/Vps4 family AAA+-type ATPase
LFDEFETIARDRNAQHEAHQAELNVLLRFLDGVEANKDVTFIGSTNTEIKDLDPAITR